MRKSLTAILAFLIIGSVFALTASEAKQEWLDAKNASINAQTAYRQANLAYAANSSSDNNQAVISTGKESLLAALDEAEAWLLWKNLEAIEKTEVPLYIKESIQEDVSENLVKIDDLRTEVSEVSNRLGLGITFLRMIGKYFELLADVARNSGSMWAYIMENRSSTVAGWENQLRTAALEIDDNTEIIAKLNLAKESIESADDNIESAKGSYSNIAIPGTPISDFANGNSYLRIARSKLVSAVNYLKQALILIAQGSDSA